MGLMSSPSFSYKLVGLEGTGSRAYSLANNYVALSSDYSGVFWNPAALSFTPVREFSLSSDYLSVVTDWQFAGDSGTDELMRVRLNELGFLLSVPTSRGGLTFGIGYLSPWTFDDISVHSGTYSHDDTTFTRKSDYRTYGGLGMVAFSMGVQVARGLGVGVTVAPVIGRENTRNPLYVKKEFNGTTETFADEAEYQRQYLGYDIRGGILASLFGDQLRLGARLSLPRTVRFTEEELLYTYGGGSLLEKGTFEGKLISSFEGAVGAAFSLPFGTVAGEFRARAPYQIVFSDRDLPENGAGQSRVGAGIGFEAPLITAPVLLRAGVSWDQVDLHRFVQKYDNQQYQWGSGNLKPKEHQYLFTLGAGYVTQNVQLSGSWGYDFRTQNAFNPGVTLKETVSSQRASATFSIRY